MFFLTKNGLINVGLISIKQSNKERQPLVTRVRTPDYTVIKHDMDPKLSIHKQKNSSFDSSFEVFCLFGINARLCLLLFWHKKTANFNDQIMMLQLSRRPTIFGLSQCTICKILNNSTMHSGQSLTKRIFF